MGRKRLRLRSYDYAWAGAYFVTVCVAEQACVLGTVLDARVELSPIGSIVALQLRQLPSRLDVGLDCFVVMPNHVHAVLVLRGGRSLGHVVGSFKSASAHEVNLMRGTTKSVFWQRGFYEHVVRNDADLGRVREYIQTNPIRWSVNA